MLGIVLVHTCNSHISDAEAGWSQVRGQTSFEAGGPCLKKKKDKVWSTSYPAILLSICPQFFYDMLLRSFENTCLF
jgi:hypothetical protein